MDINLLIEIEDFFDELDDAVDNFIDVIEIEPIRLSSDLFLTGFKRIPFAQNTMEAHLKQIKTIRTQEGTDVKYVLAAEPDGEVWFNCLMFADNTLKTAFKNFKEQFTKTNTYHLLDMQYTNKNSTVLHSFVALYNNKRQACKDTLKLKKQYENTKIKFTPYKFNIDGKLEETEKEPTDFEIVTAAVTND